jgi:hypothetical protein
LGCRHGPAQSGCRQDGRSGRYSGPEGGNTRARASPAC